MRKPLLTPRPASLFTALCIVVSLLGCSEPALPDEVAAEPNWVTIETGQGCASGRVACGRGNCAANIANNCPQPVTCELTVQCVCQAFTGESGKATGRARQTIGPGEDVGVLARVLCDDGDVLATHAQRLHCR